MDLNFLARQADLNYYFLRAGNDALINREYEKSIEYFNLAKITTPELTYILDKNIMIAKHRKKYNSTANTLKKESIDIIVPVHNALEYVKDCLQSLEKFTDNFQVHIFVINDASNKETTDWLQEFCSEKSIFTLIENLENLGYTKSVNIGLCASTAEYVVTQNSDTIVSTGWLTGMVRCMESDDKIGIVGPLSNAGGWQSVPKVKAENTGYFAVNKRPKGVTASQMAEFTSIISERLYPRITLINGFCFMIHRKVINAVGYMDEESFPLGYGEEGDYCIRTKKAGFELAVADDVYIWHAKSKSFGEKRRKEYSLVGKAELEKKYLNNDYQEALNTAIRCDDLKIVREQYKQLYKAIALFEKYQSRKILVHLHLFYHEQVDYFIEKLKNIFTSFDLFVTITEENKESKAKILAFKQDTNFIRVKNLGYDVYPFWKVINQINLDDYKYILKLHTKSKRTSEWKNNYVTFIDYQWRNELVEPLIGSVNTYIHALETLKNSSVAMIGASDLLRSYEHESQLEKTKKLCNRMKIKYNQNAEFVCGTMFFVKSEILVPFKEMILYDEDFPIDTLSNSVGTTAHSLETIFGILVSEKEMQVHATPSLSCNRSSELITINSTPLTKNEAKFTPNPIWHEEKKPLFQNTSPLTKVIAYYLPQFHPFKENDNWWGEGFTEWTNVTKAKPLFEGHYQPKTPSVMGYYDLRLPEVMEKQAKMAKEFGIYGFCFHHYYFDGKRLMERPVDQFLEHPEIDINFCLCWANENWTRRWDGKDQDILIKQNHSPEDDIRFIEHLEKYFNDSRYIRVNGNPLLIIYKVNQFPEMAETIKRWREHLEKQGKGIHLVMAQTFGEKDPTKYGFDAAVEFPPHMSASAESIKNKLDTVEGFTGDIFDYTTIITSNPMHNAPYTLYKTVFPAWDNTARRNLNAHIYAFSTPALYEEWFTRALQYSKDNNPSDQNFTFINAWNEWAEGAYLEPDKVYGYAYLNSTSKAIAKLGYQELFYTIGNTIFVDKVITPKEITPKKIALHLHLYYTDLAEEISDYIRESSIVTDLYISIPKNSNQDKIKEHFIKNENITKVTIRETENIGSDIAPFLCLFNEELVNYDIIGHIHSKKSLHTPNLGDGWRKALLTKLLPEAITTELLEHLYTKDIDLIYPQPYEQIKEQLIWHLNYEKTLKLARKLHIELPDETNNLIEFPAGCMFWCTKNLYSKLLRLELSYSDFGTTYERDGTLAHAIERLLGFIVENEKIKILSK